MPLIDLSTLTRRTGSSYPEPYAAMMEGRSFLRLGDAGGLTQFGVNLVRLEPGAVASLRHWHHEEDEFAMVTEGELLLVEEGARHLMRPGDCAAFPRGVANGHRFENHSTAPGVFLVVGTRALRDTAEYSDVDLIVHRGPEGTRFTRRDGTPVT